jgi:hypothetical protein
VEASLVRGRSLPQQQSRNYEAGDNEENIYANESAGQVRTPRVIENNEQNRDGT